MNAQVIRLIIKGAVAVALFIVSGWMLVTGHEWGAFGYVVVGCWVLGE